MELTLDGNDIPDETEEYFSIYGKEEEREKVDEEEEEYVPVIHLYFNDDLTEA
jgi:hypothetical protein